MQKCHPELILYNGKITSLDKNKTEASAIALSQGLVSALGNDIEVLRLSGESTQQIDLQGKRVIPGLNDSHIHLIRGGLNYNMELRWDGVKSLADALTMLKVQAERTPSPQWVRVVGGGVSFNL